MKHWFSGLAQRPHRWRDDAFWCLILLVYIARIVPLSLDMPRADLDPSWR